MNKAEEYFWENLPKRNLTSQNVIDREKVDFDDIINLMQQYADGENLKFAQHLNRKKSNVYDFVKYFNNWKSKQEQP